MMLASASTRPKNSHSESSPHFENLFSLASFSLFRLNFALFLLGPSGRRGTTSCINLLDNFGLRIAGGSKLSMRCKRRLVNTALATADRPSASPPHSSSRKGAPLRHERVGGIVQS